MTVSPYQVANRILLLGIALVWMIAQTSQTLAHDSWINRGGYRNPAGEWCTMLNQRCFAWRRARVVVFTPYWALALGEESDRAQPSKTNVKRNAT